MFWVPLLNLAVQPKLVIDSTLVGAGVTIQRLGYSRPDETAVMLYSNSTSGFNSVVGRLAVTATGVIVDDIIPLENVQARGRGWKPVITGLCTSMCMWISVCTCIYMCTCLYLCLCLCMCVHA